MQYQMDKSEVTVTVKAAWVKQVKDAKSIVLYTLKIRSIHGRATCLTSSDQV